MRKKMIKILAGCMFVGLMILNITTTFINEDFSITGIMSLAYGTTGDNDSCSSGSEPGGPCCGVWDVEYSPGDSTTRCYVGGSWNCFSGCN